MEFSKKFIFLFPRLANARRVAGRRHQRAAQIFVSNLLASVRRRRLAGGTKFCQKNYWRLSGAAPGANPGFDRLIANYFVVPKNRRRYLRWISSSSAAKNT